MSNDRSESTLRSRSSKSVGGCTRAAIPRRTTATSACGSTTRRLLMTPKSVCKGFMTPDMMCVTDLDGGSSRATAIPRRRCRCISRCTDSGRTSQAVVHAHPPIATGFAVAGIPLDRAVLAEVVTTLGSMPIADYATPSTKELPEAVRKYVKAHDGMLLANHGALTLGADLCSPRTTRWRRSSTSPRSASWRGCSAASVCSRGRRSIDCRGCGACTASRRPRRSARPDDALGDPAELPDRAGDPELPTERLVARPAMATGMVRRMAMVKFG